MYAPLETSHDVVQQNDLEFRLATVVLRKAVPEDLENVALDLLLRLRSDLSDHRRRFQDRIASLAKDLQSLRGRPDVEDLIERQRLTFEDEYDLFKDKLRSINLNLAQGLFSLSVPAYVTAQWGFGATGHPIVFAGGAVAASATALRYVLDRKAAKAASPCTYLLNVSRRIDAGTMAKDIVQLNLSARGDNEDDEDERTYLMLPKGPGPMGSPPDGFIPV
jgi:hypothetical protein